MVGVIQQSRSLPQAARATFEKVLQYDRSAAVAANNLAWLYVEQGVHFDLALQLALTAKAGLPQRPEVSDTLGWIHYQKGLIAQAIATDETRSEVTKRPHGDLRCTDRSSRES